VSRTDRRNARAVFRILVSGMLLVAGNSVFAQTTPSPSLVTDVPSLLPEVFVQDLEVTVQPANTITGSFTLNNTEEETIGDLRYETVILGPLDVAPNALTPDMAPVYDRAVQDDVFALAPKSTRHVTFTYHAPLLPEGPYRFRIQLRTSNDRELGWATVPLTLGGATTFGVLDAWEVQTESTDLASNTPRQSWAPLEGVNVRPEQPLTFRAGGRAVGTDSLTGTLSITTTRILQAEEATATTEGESVTLLPGSPAQNIIIPFTAATAPGAYVTRVSLTDARGSRVSSIAEFRYVVRGTSASVVSATFSDLRTRRGETTTVALTVVGPADRQTKTDGTVEIALLDGEAVAGTTTAPVEFSAAPRSATIPVQLQKTISVPALRVTLKGPDGTVLDTYDATFPGIGQPAGPAPAGEGQRPGGLLTITILLLALLLLLVLVRRKWVRPSAGTLTIVLFVLPLLGATVFSARRAESGYQAGVFWDNSKPINLFVNQPQDGKIGSLSVPYDVRIEWIACGNSETSGEITPYALMGSAFVTSRTRPANPGERVVTASGPIFQWQPHTIRFQRGDNATFTSAVNPPPPPDYLRSPAPWTRYTSRSLTVRDGCAGSPPPDFCRLTKTYSGVLSLRPGAGNKATVWTSASAYANGAGYAGVIDDFRWITVLPNLLPQNLAASNPTPTEDDLITFSGRVRNAGGWPADPSRARFCISDANDANDTCLTTANGSVGEAAVPRLGVGATAGPFTSTPWKAVEGNHMLHLCADVGQTVEESNERDNCAKLPFKVARKADLVSVALRMNGQAVSSVPEGQSVTFEGKVKNEGGTRAGASRARFCIDNPDCLRTTADSLGEPQVRPLDRNGAISPPLTSGTWTATSVRQHSITLCADVGFSVVERSEENNCSTVLFPVTSLTPDDGDGNLPPPHFEEVPP
jgi:CARDB protein